MARKPSAVEYRFLTQSVYFSLSLFLKTSLHKDLNHCFLKVTLERRGVEVQKTTGLQLRTGPQFFSVGGLTTKILPPHFCPRFREGSHGRGKSRKIFALGTFQNTVRLKPTTQSQTSIISKMVRTAQQLSDRFASDVRLNWRKRAERHIGQSLRRLDHTYAC